MIGKMVVQVGDECTRVPAHRSRQNTSSTTLKNTSLLHKTFQIFFCVHRIFGDKLRKRVHYL